MYHDKCCNTNNFCVEIFLNIDAKILLCGFKAEKNEIKTIWFVHSLMPDVLHVFEVKFLVENSLKPFFRSMLAMFYIINLSNMKPRDYEFFDSEL